MQLAVWTLAAWTVLMLSWSDSEICEVCSDGEMWCFADRAPFKGTPANCAQALHQGGGKSGIYRIELPGTNLSAFDVYCLADPEGTVADAWTLMMRRNDGSTDFYRTWQEYRDGFGDLGGEFVLGFDKVNAIEARTPHELWIEMGDFEGGRCSANYSDFVLGSEDEGFALTRLGRFRGSCGNSMAYHEHMPFSTVDRDNDKSVGCVAYFHSPGWHKKCFLSNLFGSNLRGNISEPLKGGIIWQTWRGSKYSLKYVHMAIRPKMCAEEADEHY